MKPYDKQFYVSEAQSSARSAATIVPLLVELVAPGSVLDVGCGVGAFLAEFMRQGVGEVLGMDSDWVPADDLVIPRERFVTANLADSIPTYGRFDLVICLEVAEHLPESRAAGFVEDLCAHAAVVAFSAAIPQQGGTEHLNEQWPSYWAALFEGCGYRCFDVLRPLLWSESQVDRWYAQNLLLFSSERRFEVEVPFPLDIVHPREYERARRSPTTRQLATELRRRVVDAGRRRLGFR